MYYYLSLFTFLILLLENFKLHMWLTFVPCIILPSDDGDLEYSFIKQIFLKHLVPGQVFR